MNGAIAWLGNDRCVIVWTGSRDCEPLQLKSVVGTGLTWSSGKLGGSYFDACLSACPKTFVPAVERHDVVLPNLAVYQSAVEIARLRRPLSRGGCALILPRQRDGDMLGWESVSNLDVVALRASTPE